MPESEVLSRETVYSGRIVTLAVERVRLPNDETVSLEIVHHRGAAAAVPIDADGRVILVRQYRHATASWLLEVPAGKLDHPGESPEACARREVEEEAGFRAGEMVPLGWIWVTPGYSDEKIWLYLARDLTPVPASLEPDEVLTVEPLPLAEAVRQATSGAIVDAKSVCAILRAASINSTR
ncbi:MAG TPA: NUDIX hydrolase [Candidatus Polarisedimenticolaceae bacterium]|nr:NUDIX hydrolase [Candidatus Polarisedimenticolaceae bacterium]